MKMHSYKIRFLFLLACLVGLGASIQAQEICNNGIDDDGDGFIDCGDTECGSSVSCSDAFTCNSTLYQVISNALKELDVTTGTYVTLGSASANYNGAGYNVQDGYIYGIYNSGGQRLWRINNQGAETDLGSIANYGGRAFVGDFDKSGNLYTYAQGTSPALYYIDVDATPLQAIEVSVTNLSGGSIPGVKDITYNIITQKFYGLSSGMELLEIDPVAKTIDIIGNLSGTFGSSGGFGAAWSDSGGFSYFANNTDGRIYRATFDGNGNVIATVHIATGEPTNSNDGMGCFLGAPPFETDCTNGIDDDGDGLIDCNDPDCGFEPFCANVDVSIDVTSETGPGGVVSYHIFLTNDSDSDATSISVSDAMPSGFTYIGDTIEFDAGGSFDESLQPTYGSTGTLTWGSITLPAGTSMRISYDARVGASQPNGIHTNGVIINGASSTGTHSADVTINRALTENPAYFNCDPALYQVYQKRGQPNVYGKLDPNTGDYTVIATISHQANGLGFDPRNGLAYGAVGREFISLDDVGTVKTLGLSFSKKIYVGDMDTLGYWYGKEGGDIKKIDVSGPTLVATYSGEGMPGWDMAYNKDGNFYAVHNATLYKFNTSTNTKSTVGALTGDAVPSGGFGAQWTGKNGYLYISHNSTGKVFRVDVNTREARFVLASTAGLRYNDGFSCPIEIPALYKKDYSDLSSLPSATHFVYAQDVYADNIPDYDMVWLGTKVSEETTDPSNALATGDSHDDGLVYPTVYKAGDSATISITLRTTMSDVDIYYGLWMDWNGDGTFDDFYTDSERVTTAAVVDQKVNVPSNFAGGNMAIRCRVSETAFRSNDHSGELYLGEVEDYLINSRVAGTGTKEIAYLKVNFACDAPDTRTKVYNNNADNDLDNDGIPNDSDPDPTDPNKQFVQYRPSANSFGTLAYEDLWPQKGDYDFNDFVVEIKEGIVTNQNNKIYQFTYDLRIMAMGGQYNNDFCIAFPDPNTNATFELYSPHSIKFSSEAAGGYKIIKINKPKELLDVPTTEVVNASLSGSYYTPIEMQIVVELDGSLDYPANYTPKFFLEGNGINGHEIHLPNTEPTAAMKSGLFGTVDDDSNAGSGKYYLSDTNLPWALYLPTSWKYPLEKVDLLNAYFRFDEYVQQDANLSWYIDDDSYRNSGRCFNKH
ncbi:MAG: LruC domain-containing protein [Bacteroidota bacterium]